MIEKAKRKTYSIDNNKANELAHHALNMGVELGKTVSKQSVLDVLIGLLADEEVYKKALEEIGKWSVNIVNNQKDMLNGTNGLKRNLRVINKRSVLIVDCITYGY